MGSEFERACAIIINELGEKPMGDTRGDQTHLNLLPALEQMAREKVTGKPFRVKLTELFPHPDENQTIFNCLDCLRIIGKIRTALEVDLTGISQNP